MEPVPLIAHDSPNALIAFRAGVPIRAGQFLADVHSVRSVLPAGRHLLNSCLDRYRFTVGMGAALLAQKVTLLPPMHTRESIRELTAFASDAFCLTDHDSTDVELPLVRYPPERPSPAIPWSVPAIDPAQLTAYAFTSGTAGTPVPHKKHWGKLVRCVRKGAIRLGLRPGVSHAIVSTVPPQHMYGFELSVLLALQSGNALCAERPFYPADICRTLSELPTPRLLVSTPVHLQSLLTSDVHLPPIELIISSTAALSQEGARSVESRFCTRLIEIYGSTETGQMASRRTAQTSAWELWPDVQIRIEESQAWAHDGHLEQRTALGDVIELVDDRRFLLRGRTSDLVNIAGKRSSLVYLNRQLNSIPGVIDGAFVWPGEERSSALGVSRLAAIVVAPGLSAQALIQELRERIDPVFLPRPLVFVSQLPRNATGKLPLAALQALLEPQPAHGGTVTAS